tara:strand:- start:5696 stop:6403 length:708 start_codon:yes stop_codon:yes gene_type:complete
MKNQKGFALVLALVLLVVMSLMGGALIVVSSGDHQTNNNSDNYQQTFYVAETALLEGEKYLMNQHLGPWNTKTNKRGDRNVTPQNKTEYLDAKNKKTSYFTGYMEPKNYKSSDPDIIDTETRCLNSFHALKKGTTLKVVVGESYNFGNLISTALKAKTKDEDEEKQITRLKSYYYEYFIIESGSASFSGAGSSIKKSATDSTSKGIAYKIYGCGIYGKEDRMVVALESSIVLPRQ